MTKNERNDVAPSRRLFLKTLAASTAAALAGPAAGIAIAQEQAAKTAEKPAAPTPRKLPAEVRPGIEEQKAYLRQTLESIRKYRLETNSDQAFSFAAMKAKRAQNTR